jgi:YfiH family protein
MHKFITPDWPAPLHVHALTTTRAMGFFSQGAARNDTLLHEELLVNQQGLKSTLALPSTPTYLQQVHGIDVIPLGMEQTNSLIADGAYTTKPNIICSVTTADCLPILLTNLQGTQVAALHAGWRGLAAGIIEQGIKTFANPPNLLAWLGPAIGPAVYEVGDEVRAQFLKFDAQAVTAFIPSPNQRWLANLYLLARQRLTACGVVKIYGGEHCTFTESDLFFSYRREKDTGRIGMASLIWLSLA